MADSTTSVRFLQHHLRQAGALLASKELGAAAAHIDAALAIDPESLAALTLRERLEKYRATDAPHVAEVPRADSDAAPTRFVPAGVDAASWLDFEQRVQERRFRALVDTAERAIAAGDGAGAQAALEEAGELRPDSGEVQLLSARVPRVSAAALERPPESLLRSRPFRAASLLIVGVTFLIGLDWVRSEPTSASHVVPAESTESLAELAFADVAPAREAVPDVPPLDSLGTTGVSTSPTEVAPDADVPPAAPPVIAPRRIAEREIGATSVRAPESGETPDDYFIGPTPNPREQVVLAAPALRGEIRESVAPRLEPVAPRPDLANVARAPASIDAGSVTGSTASAIRPPAPVAEPAGAVAGRASSAAPSSVPAPGLPPSTLAAPAAAVVSPPLDESRVASVLQQYTRAYGRLDAAAVRAIWPSVDERALAKAFSSLSVQTVYFDNCDIDVNGATARASCRGRASYVGKVGNQVPRTESRTVQFELRRDGEAWKIEKADARK